MMTLPTPCAATLVLAGCLSLAAPLSASDGRARAPSPLPWAERDAGEATRAIEGSPFLVAGRVLDREGLAVAGAAVVSSAGGLASTDEEGRFELELFLEDQALAVQVTAAASALGAERLVASVRLDLARERGRADAGDLQLALTACEPSWLPSFGPASGIYRVHALAVHDDGSGPKLLVGGEFWYGDGDVQALVAWDGTRWSPLGAGLGGSASLGFYPSVRAFAVFDDGSGPALFVGGDFTTAGGAPANRIAKWNGTSWSALGSGLSGPVFALSVHSDGLLYVGGDFLNAGGVTAPRIARWNGFAWASAGIGLFTVRALVSTDLGAGPQLFAGGDFSSVQVWNGTGWSVVGGPLNSGGTVSTMLAHDDGTGPSLFVGGAFTSVGGVSTAGIARWDGSSWHALLGGPYRPVTSMVVHDDGSGPALYCSFRFPSSSQTQVMRWDGQDWENIGVAIYGGNFGSWIWSLASYDDGGGAKLYAGGDLIDFGSPIQPVRIGVVCWEDPSWNQLATGLDAWVMTLASHDDGSGPALFAGGIFLAPEGNYSGYGPARWSGGAWQSLTNFSFVTGTNSPWWSTSFVSHDDGTGHALFLGGGFDVIGGVSANRIARWNGTSWSALGSGLGGVPFALAVFDDGTGPMLYAGGLFTSAGGSPASFIARWNGATWSALGAGLGSTPSSWVSALAVYDDGSGPALYAGGNFDSAGGSPAARMARWDGSNWSALGSGMDAYVNALAVHDDGSGPALYAGGNFGTAGGSPAARIARWDGSSWSTLGSGMNGEVFALASFDDGSGPALFAGGKFTVAGGVAARRIARWDGTSWSPLGSGLSGAARCFAVHDDGDGPALFVGGGFAQSPSDDSYLAKWGPCSGPSTIGVPFCFGLAADCPCGNGGLPGRGCENAQATGGVELTASGRPSHNTVVLQGSGFPPAATPGVVVLRGPNVEPSPVPFGDGIRCVGTSGLVRLGATSASGGLSTHPLNHAAGPGAFHYQLWYRSAPQSYCNPTATFNASNGLSIVWP